MNQKGLTPILIFIVIAIAMVGGYLIYQKQSQTKTVINPQGYSGPPPEKILRIKSHEECKDENELCNLLSKILKNVKNSDYSSLLNLQEFVEKTCITGGLSASVCDGAKEGEIRKGYMIGAQYSEYDIVSDNQYITRLNEYFRSNAPLDYAETIISTNRASVVYSHKNKQTFLIFDLHKNESDWKIQGIILGIDHKTYLKAYYPTLE